MSVKVPWDDLRKDPNAVISENIKVEVEEERGLQADARNIGKHALFGTVIGALTGATVSSIELMRDPRQMARGQRGLATKRMGRMAAELGIFFAGFHGMRKAIQLYAPKTSADRQIDFLQVSGIAAAVSLTPVLVVPRLRPLFPYGIFLITMDAINSYTSA